MRAVDEVSTSRSSSGEFFGLLGPNGAGKSTTIGMLTTTVVPTSGRAFVAGIDVRTQPAAVKRRIGVVSQSNTLDRSLTVWENLYYHGRFFGCSRREARRGPTSCSTSSPSPSVPARWCSSSRAGSRSG